MTVARESVPLFDETELLYVVGQAAPDVLGRSVLEETSEDAVGKASPVYLSVDHFQDYCWSLTTHPGLRKEARAAGQVYWSLWSGAEAQNRINDLEGRNLIPDQMDYAHSEAWQLSGLRMSLDRRYLDVRSLVDSVENGSIQTIIGDDAAHTTALVHFLEEYGITAKPNSKELEYDPALLPNYLALVEDRSHQDFFAEVFTEAKNQPYRGKDIVGPLKDRFNEHIAVIKQQLAAIDPDLPLEVLHAEYYQSRDVHQLVASFDFHVRNRIEMLGRYLPVRHRLLAIDLWPAQRDHVIEAGVLDRPRYIQQKDPTRCANTAFRMIFQGVTGESVSELAVDPPSPYRFLDEYRHDKEYLSVFHSQRFKEQYGVGVQTICFSGMTLETIAKLARKVKAADNTRKVFVATALETETAKDKRIQHRTVLLGAEEDEVILHDPAPGVGEAERRLTKREFCKRWAATQNSGYMVIAAPK